jgi:hypothetical protein
MQEGMIEVSAGADIAGKNTRNINIPNPNTWEYLGIYIQNLNTVFKYFRYFQNNKLISLLYN